MSVATGQGSCPCSMQGLRQTPQIPNAPTPLPACRGRSQEEQEVKTAEYEEKFSNPMQAAKYGFIDDVIAPQDTRRRLCAELEVLKDKQATRPWRKHGNVPL